MQQLGYFMISDNICSSYSYPPNQGHSSPDFW